MPGGPRANGTGPANGTNGAHRKTPDPAPDPDPGTGTGPEPAADGGGPGEEPRDASNAVPDAAAEPGGNGEPGESGASDGEEERREGAKRGKQRSFWKELPILIGIAIVLALLIKTFLLQAFSIPSDSMQDTLQRGDRVLVDKLTPWFGAEPGRGDVIVFEDPDDWLGDTPSEGGFGAAVQDALSFIGLMPSAEDQDLIKRVIAVGGDTVECHGEGPVLVNGVELDESDYLKPGSTPCGDRSFGPITVPEGRLWVLGDNRQESLDSRYHPTAEGRGTVSEKDVVGRAIVVAWPVNRWSVLGVPDSFGVVDGAASAAPAAFGLAGAVPLVLWRRRLLAARQDLAGLRD